MRWYGACGAGLLGLVGAFVLVFAIPLRVRVRFSRRGGSQSLRVWAGVWDGLVWIPVYRYAKLVRPSGAAATAAATANATGTGTTTASAPGRSPDARARRARRAEAGPPLGRRLVRFFYRALRSTGLRVHRLRVQVDLGSGDAATTAIGVGVAHAAIGLAIARSPVPLKFARARPEVAVTPRYDRACVEGSVDCIASFSPGYTVLEGIRLARRAGRRAGARRARIPRERASPP